MPSHLDVLRCELVGILSPSPLANLYSWLKLATSPGRKQGAGHQIRTSSAAHILTAFLLAALPHHLPLTMPALGHRKLSPELAIKNFVSVD